MASARRKLRACALVALLLAGCKTQGEWGKYEHRKYLPSVSQLRDSSDDEFYFAFPVGIERRRFALLALESLTIGSDVHIRPTDPSFYASVSSVLPPGYGAFVGSLGQMQIREGAVVGSIYAWDSGTEIGQRALAAGYIKHADASFDSGAYATLGVLENRADAVALYTFTPPLDRVADFAPSRRTGTAGHPPVQVPPGAYNEIVAADGATLRFSSGSYRARALRIEDGAVLEIDNSEGPVDIWIEQDLAVHGMIEERLLMPNILVLYAGREPLLLSQPFRGTLVAARADVTILATEPPHVGAFYARKIDVAPKTEIRHVTFFREMQPPVGLAQMCEKCAASTRAELSTCIAGLEQPQPPARFARQFLATECAQAAHMAFQRCLLDEHWRPGSCRTTAAAARTDTAR